MESLPAAGRGRQRKSDVLRPLLRPESVVRWWPLLTQVPALPALNFFAYLEFFARHYAIPYL
jgi:hypothetical protein